MNELSYIQNIYYKMYIIYFSYGINFNLTICSVDWWRKRGWLVGWVLRCVSCRLSRLRNHCVSLRIMNPESGRESEHFGVCAVLHVAFELFTFSFSIYSNVLLVAADDDGDDDDRTAAAERFFWFLLQI